MDGGKKALLTSGSGTSVADTGETVSAEAAVSYNDLGDRAPRLVALDEVPSEVDESGRIRLASYIAALGLDLIYTSHGWDGAPGAWDGIDLYDLEAGSDGWGDQPSPVTS